MGKIGRRAMTKKQYCPQCKNDMIPRQWQNRIKWICLSCGIMWWDGSTSTPATQEVFDLRKKCHKKFDQLWKSGEMTRKEAYKYMQKIMNLPKHKCHIGMFQKTECEKLLGLFEEKAGGMKIKIKDIVNLKRGGII